MQTEIIRKITDDLKKQFKKPFRWAAFFSIIMTFAIIFVLLDTFIIPRAGTAIAAEFFSTASFSATAANSGSQSTSSESASDVQVPAEVTPVITSTSYKDTNIHITITTVRKYDTTIYAADIQLSSIAYLKTAFANNTYGRNIKATTSAIAEQNNAIFAINGDYYGFRDTGFVLRNGVLYRNTARKAGSDEALAIDSQGNFSIINESSTDAQSLVKSNVLQVLSFGPALIRNGTISVTANSEVGQSMTSNPRTAIGQISALHYIIIVSDGRTSESAGLSLLELAQEMKAQGCTTAYNLDGGGSSTMWFNGQVVNNPANGKSSSERSVSDIVYIS